jgi:hypothetical protein
MMALRGPRGMGARPAGGHALPDPAGARADRQATAYREEVEAWRQAAEDEENRQALERAKSCLPWWREGSPA